MNKIRPERGRLSLLVAVVVALALIPGLALAATPKKSAQFCINCTKTTIIGQFETSSDGKSVLSWHAYSKCSHLPATVTKVPVRNGVLKFTKTAKDPIGDKVTYIVNARFTKATTMTGTFVQKTSSCNSGKVKFTAKYSGKATG